MRLIDWDLFCTFLYWDLLHIGKYFLPVHTLITVATDSHVLKHQGISSNSPECLCSQNMSHYFTLQTPVITLWHISIPISLNILLFSLSSHQIVYEVLAYAAHCTNDSWRCWINFLHKHIFIYHILLWLVIFDMYFFFWCEWLHKEKGGTFLLRSDLFDSPPQMCAGSSYSRPSMDTMCSKDVPQHIESLSSSAIQRGTMMLMLSLCAHQDWATSRLICSIWRRGQLPGSRLLVKLLGIQ